MEQDIDNDGVSLKEIIDHLSEIKKSILKNKYYALAFILICAASGLTASLLIKPKYTATLSFATQDDEKTGGLSSIASQFGFSVGGSSGGAFGGDNLFELLTSRSIIEKALLCPTSINGKTDNLLNLYIKTYDLSDNWKDHKLKEIRDLQFPVKQSRQSFSRAQDSILQKVCVEILKKPLLSAAKRSKKLSIGDISFVSENETLSKLFVENLMRETTDFYVETKTKITRQNYNVLKHQTDSVKAEYESAVSQRAHMADNLLNAVRPSAGIGMIKKQTDMQVAAATYMEMKKNLEIMKINLGRETPLVQVIDSPILPLEKTRLGKAKGIILGGFIGGFLIIFFFTLMHIKKTIKKDL